MTDFMFPLSLLKNIIGEGSVIEVDYPYEENDNSKKRPAVVLYNGSEITLIALKISSSKKFLNGSNFYAIEISDLESAGLKKQSWVLTNKELVVNINNKFTYLGTLSELDLEKVKAYHKLALNKCIVSKQFF